MKKLLFPLLLVFLFMNPLHISALSCAEPYPMEVAFEKYDGVLIGSVDEIKSGLGTKKFAVDVERSFKGVDEKRITVFEDITWGETQTGSTYLFFLNKDGDKWIHQLCTPTTHNTALADEAFSDKEEIVLQDVKSAGGSGGYLFVIVPAVLLLLGAAAVFWFLAAKKRNRRGRE